MVGCATPTGPLATLPISSPQASQLNLEGIQEYNRGQWKPAKKKFELAIQADPNLPEAHFNLALTLHKLELHDQATSHFRQAGELAPNNKEIVDSTIYRNHLGLSSTLERHFSGGYRY
jgi:Tfp pilus assembly protein PilF